MENKLNKFLQSVLFLSINLLLLISCDNDNLTRELKNNYEQLPELKPNDSIILTLDSVTEPRLVNPQIINLNNARNLAMLNVVDNSIKLFDLESNKLINTLSFAKEGPEGINDIISFHFANQDSLFVLDDTYTLHLFDHKNNKVFSRQIKSEKYPGAPLFMHTIPMTRIDSGFIIANYYTNRKNRFMNLVLSFPEFKITYKNQIPDEVIDGFYGLKNFADWNYSYNRSLKKFVFNFPNSDSLYFYDNSLKLDEKKLFLSTLMKDKIEPLFETGITTEQAMQDNPNLKKVLHKFKNSPIYRWILYDQGSEKYLRLFGLPIGESDIDLEDPVRSEIRHTSLMVSGDSFESVNEYRIPFNQYWFYKGRFFIDQSSLYIQRKSEFEDRIILHAFDIERL